MKQIDFLRSFLFQTIVFFALAACISVVPVLAKSETDVSPAQPGTISSFDIQNYYRPAILDGYFASPDGAFSRFTVFIEVFSEDGVPTGTCTGVIIAEDIILSAGHCAHPSKRFKVKVSFGVGGPKGFTDTVFAEDYVSFYGNPPQESSSGSGSYLGFDRWAQTRFEIDVSQRTGFVNFFKEMPRSDFEDLMVIRVPKIPKGYKRVEFYSGPLPFRMPVTMAGFGLSTRVFAQHETRLRWSDGELVGHYTENQAVTMGYQVYSPTRQQSCFGDSGGPLVTLGRDGKTYFLMGITLSQINGCANSNFFLNPLYYAKSISLLVVQLRKRKKI
jgi:hypothetical protein